MHRLRKWLNKLLDGLTAAITEYPPHTTTDSPSHRTYRTAGIPPDTGRDQTETIIGLKLEPPIGRGVFSLLEPINQIDSAINILMPAAVLTRLDRTSKVFLTHAAAMLVVDAEPLTRDEFDQLDTLCLKIWAAHKRHVEYYVSRKYKMIRLVYAVDLRQLPPKVTPGYLSAVNWSDELIRQDYATWKSQLEVL